MSHNPPPDTSDDDEIEPMAGESGESYERRPPTGDEAFSFGDKSAQIERLLKSYFWPQSLAAGTRYVRLHDDHDGKFEGRLSIVIGEDGDAWIGTDGPEPLRFRMPSTGGGRSQYTRTALVILAEAIRMDNEEDARRGRNRGPLPDRPA